jgi:hypothetical protein
MHSGKIQDSGKKNDDRTPMEKTVGIREDHVSWVAKQD